MNTHHNVWVNDKGFAVNFLTEEEVRGFVDCFELIKIERFDEGKKRLFGVFLRKK